MMGDLAESDYARGLGAMPSVRVERQGEDYSELVLEWVHLPGDGLWTPVEEHAIDIAKAAFPDLLTEPEQLTVTVRRETVVGMNVTLDDEQVAHLEEQSGSDRR